MLLMKFPAHRLAAVLGMAIGAGLMAPAYAEVIDLTCDSPLNKSAVLYVSFDTGANTATVWSNGQTRDTEPKLPAAFSDQKVTWRLTAPTGYQGGLVEDFAFDRGTGALNVNAWSNGRASSNAWNCKRASRVF